MERETIDWEVSVHAYLLKTHENKIFELKGQCQHVLEEAFKFYFQNLCELLCRHFVVLFLWELQIALRSSHALHKCSIAELPSKPCVHQKTIF